MQCKCINNKGKGIQETKQYKEQTVEKVKYRGFEHKNTLLINFFFKGPGYDGASKTLVIDSKCSFDMFKQREKERKKLWGITLKKKPAPTDQRPAT